MLPSEKYYLSLADTYQGIHLNSCCPADGDGIVVLVLRTRCVF